MHWTGSGFTLIELLVVIAIAGVLTAIAVPSLTKMMANARVRSTAQAFHSSMLKARSEALKRNTTVTIRRDGGSWSNGWQVVDEGPDPDVVLESSVPASRVSLTEESDPALTSIAYLRSGRLSATATAPFMRIADEGNRAQDRCVQVDLSGRPAVIVEDAATDDDC